ncbi:hypothetical protein Lfu02_26450 [Longispora fulva]|uniref:Uncharacterized protein n=1 Tax=Longispora fulva TaxID=619741 RepID=A0A8J7GV45_9ACTN|nr:hypothetical protein [Longispora fulva]MBG6138778.1 hypothetical protein [Longispora fulva]GIG58273.1 hypothetical protein Lfu02_26450 [Longispora fulva]
MTAVSERLSIVGGAHTDTGVTLPSDQSSFWAAGWQAGEREIEAERSRGGRGHVFESEEEFLEFLRSDGS